MSFSKADFEEQSKRVITALHESGKFEWRWDPLGYIFHESEIGDLTTPIHLENDDDIIEEEPDAFKVDLINKNFKKRYKMTHNVIYNTSYQVPQLGVSIFDQIENRFVVKLNEATEILKKFNGREVPDNTDSINMFITLDEHPLIDDLYMFFIHPCGTSSTIETVISTEKRDYLICYLSSYGPDVCCFENYLALQHVLLNGK
ncbi:hypothetical protein EIN_083300 [Entamoeba invadens IP1]|uniref:hypothetical protein n=1 Tax=Entamoeba invadens IP1 TaxID=370355 RepID=UPI0002C3F8EA|nr:hypothetical protein EIN_083300 [Entamoeba invadens IP1]ELP85208.1 hypothetical protein EIN_083300 [Entamoeba invadens IP1]|eukprot:XP_004184554.1 hypothetical protein EIN_083300 [Entamoeba invadens IP1]